MGWWSRLLDRLRGAPLADLDRDWVQEPASIAETGEPQVFECQTCFKVFEAGRPGALCPECDSPDVIALTR